MQLCATLGLLELNLQNAKLNLLSRYLLSEYVRVDFQWKLLLLSVLSTLTSSTLKLTYCLITAMR